MILLIAFAFLAGVVTILSPCILPILPIVLSSSTGGKKKPLGVVAGFILSFTFFTLLLSSIVKATGISADSLRVFSIIVIAGFGFSLLVPQFQLLIEKMFTKLSGLIPQRQQVKEDFGSGFLIGLSVGLLWTPCVGPILASVISLALTGSVTGTAFLITLAYSLGTAIPMLVVMYGGRALLTKNQWLLRNTTNIQKAFGVLMIITAIGIFFNVDRRFQAYILTTFPQYGAGLTKFEDNETIKKQLNKTNDTEVKKEDIGKPTSDLMPKGPIAPEIIPGGIWFNSDPLTLQKLKGKVVIIDFWTYSCINCQRTFPYLRQWHEKYKDKGLVIIGVHSPEFEFEKSVKNVAQAIKDFKLPYPIVQDNDFATWKAYENRYWPAKYIVDKDGYIRYTHFGEGAYTETEKVIQDLLKETGQQVNIKVGEYQESRSNIGISPEGYLGSARMLDLVGIGKAKTGMQEFVLEEDIPKNKFSFGGSWNVADEYSKSVQGAILAYNFTAEKVFLVMKPGATSGKVKVFLDRKLLDTKGAGKDVINGTITVGSDRLYELIDLKGSTESHILKLEFSEGIEAFAFTFG